MTATALITGGTGGLGIAVTERLLASGWRVVAPYNAPRELERVDSSAAIAAHRNELELIEADLFDAGHVTAAVKAASADKDAPLRAVVNLVGGFAAGRVHETGFDEFQTQLELNLRPTYLVTAAALPHLIDHAPAAIVCVSTRAALRPFSGAAGYVVAKSAVLAFVDALAVEYTAQGIRANAILPSIIDTPANRAAQPEADHSRWVAPAEIAAVIGFLCEDASAPISGAHIPVYGRA